MGKYDAVATRVLATITAKGGVVTFPGTATGQTYDPLTDTWTGAAGADATAKAVQIEGDPDTLQALGLISANSVTLLIAASGMSLIPEAGVLIKWAGRTYTIRAKEDTNPDGASPILYEVTAAA